MVILYGKVESYKAECGCVWLDGVDIKNVHMHTYLYLYIPLYVKLYHLYTNNIVHVYFVIFYLDLCELFQVGAQNYIICISFFSNIAKHNKRIIAVLCCYDFVTH